MGVEYTQEPVEYSINT